MHAGSDSKRQALPLNKCTPSRCRAIGVNKFSGAVRAATSPAESWNKSERTLPTEISLGSRFGRIPCVGLGHYGNWMLPGGREASEPGCSKNSSVFGRRKTDASGIDPLRGDGRRLDAGLTAMCRNTRLYSRNENPYVEPAFSRSNGHSEPVCCVMYESIFGIERQVRVQTAGSPVPRVGVKRGRRLGKRYGVGHSQAMQGYHFCMNYIHDPEDGWAPMKEYFRPWKLFTFACGLGLLIVGSFYYPAPDWDVSISVIMGTLAYLTAPWALRVVLERRWRFLPAALFATWFTVDGCYWLYWRAVDPIALEMMRDANFLASLALYGMCGVLWLYRGTLRELVRDIRRLSATYHGSLGEMPNPPAS